MTQNLPAPVAALKPVPSAATVRKATAIALHEAQLAEKRRLNKAEEDARGRLAEACRKLVRKEAKRLEFSVTVASWRNAADATATVTLTAANSPTLDTLRTAYQNARQANSSFTVQKPADIEAELRGVARTFVADPVKHLLSDPKLKAALLAAGKKALSQPTPADKATAIEA